MRARTDPFPDRLPPSRTVTVRAVDGTRLHAQVFGPPDGYPIVLTHGITCAIRAWAYQIDDLAGDYRVIAYDHRGHGRSGVPKATGYSLKHLAADLDSVLEATLAPHERAVLAGHSMGGITIAAWSNRYRHKVSRRADAVALINTTSGELIRQVQLLSVPPGLSPARVLAGRRADRRVRRVRGPAGGPRPEPPSGRAAGHRARRRPGHRPAGLRAVREHRAGGAGRLRAGAGLRVGVALPGPGRADGADAGHRQRTGPADTHPPVPQDRRGPAEPDRAGGAARRALLDAGTPAGGEPAAAGARRIGDPQPAHPPDQLIAGR